MTRLYLGRRLWRSSLVWCGVLASSAVLRAQEPTPVPRVLPPPLSPAPADGPNVAPGCCNGAPHGLLDFFHDPCATIPPGAIPSRPGASVRAWNSAMATRAYADRFVIYNNEWFMGGTKLGPRGESHLRQLVAKLAEHPLPVILQPEDPPELTEARRLLLVKNLTAMGVPNAALRVVVDCAEAEGLRGDEAIQAYPRMIQAGRTGSSGAGVGGAGAAGVSTPGALGVTSGRGGY